MVTTTVDWSTVADAWDLHTEHVEAMKEAATGVLLERVALRPGDRVLELGAGSGALGARLGRLVAPGGTVLVTDVAAGMVQLARGRTAGVPGVTVAQIDASSITEPDGSFDAVLFRMGLMFTPDPAVALAEIHRVLAPAGRAGIVVWAGPEHNPWLTGHGMAAMANGLVRGGPPVGPGEVFSLGDPHRLHDLLAQAGFRDARVDEVDLEARFSDIDHYLAVTGSLAPPLAAARRAATADEIAAVRRTAAELLAAFTTHGGLVVPARALVASGRT